MFNIRQLFMVALGGLIGSVIRYLTSIYISSATGTTLFPWSTFVVNVTGSFVIGLVLGYCLHNQNFETNWRLFLATGLCGGFTTFSAFSNESYLLLKQQHYGILIGYVFVVFVLSIGATAAGYWLSR